MQSVVENLLIAHVELRSEEADDIKPYVFERNIEKIVIPLSGELKTTKALFLQVKYLQKMILLKFHSTKLHC